uniref:E2 n=1 Tax=Lactococcus phage 5440 TaxID=206062 RepID=Q7Y4G5_9CAUD|nr:E2 [Lactococcus phage 5440]
MLSRLLYSRFGKFIKRRVLIDNFSNFCHYNFIVDFLLIIALIIKLWRFFK